MQSVHNFEKRPISCHSWNADRTHVALSLSDNDLCIYKKILSGWEKVYTLTEHTGKITGVDWAPNTNQIVTCGADRNAYVWKLESGRWLPTLVLLRINRAATCVAWSPLENKFAVGTGARLICVCYFDALQNWWLSKHIKKPIRSTILCLEWHPNNCLIAVGSTDFKTRIFAAGIKEIEAKPEKTGWAGPNYKPAFGSLVVEFGSGTQQGGWVRGVTFSSSGNKLAWVTHSSQIGIVVAGDTKPLVCLTDILPFTDVQWISEEKLIVVGYNCVPLIYRYDNNVLELHEEIDKAEETGSEELTAIQVFKQMSMKGSSERSEEVKSIHKNVIWQIAVHGKLGDNVSTFSTTGADGTMVLWKLV